VGWTLPYKQIPWALPFDVGQQDAIAAFSALHDARLRITLRAVRPCVVPFYIFDGKLRVEFTGVAGYDDGGESDARGITQATEYVRRGLSCPPLPIGAGTGGVSAVYAGFDFRRAFLRQALTGNLSEALLEQAVPLPSVDLPAGTYREAFQMKPSFAYIVRVQDRLPEVAHHIAEQQMDANEARALPFWREDGSSQTPAEVEPAYTRVEDVTHEMTDARLHDRGVITLPVWAVEYLFLGKPYRAFVSGVRPSGGGAAVAAGMQHGSPLGSERGATWESLTSDSARTFRAIGDLRRMDVEANMAWKVQRHWLDEVERVMPPGQKPVSAASGAGFGGFKAFRPGGCDVKDGDYELLGLPTHPPPTSSEISAAFRRSAMTWHPDLQQGKSAEEQAACREHFERVVKAHERLQEAHPAYMDGRR